MDSLYCILSSKTTSKWKFSCDKEILERNHHPSIFLEFMWKIGRLRLYVLQWRCFIFKRLDSTLSLSQIHQGWHQILNGSRFSKGFVSYRLHHFSKPWQHCHCTKSISFRLFRFSFFRNDYKTIWDAVEKPTAWKSDRGGMTQNL